MSVPLTTEGRRGGLRPFWDRAVRRDPKKGEGYTFGNEASYHDRCGFKA
jgi:hypothetical protein